MASGSALASFSLISWSDFCHPLLVVLGSYLLLLLRGPLLLGVVVSREMAERWMTAAIMVTFTGSVSREGCGKGLGTAGLLGGFF